MASRRKGDDDRRLPRTGRAPGAGLTSFEDPPRADLMGPPRGRRGVDPTQSLWCHHQPRDTAPTSHPVPGLSTRMRTAAPRPHGQKPRCLGFPTDGGRAGSCPLCSSFTSVHPADRPPPARPASASPPHPLPAAKGVPRRQPQKALCCPARPSEQCPPVCPGKRLCGGGARWAPGHRGQPRGGRAGGGGESGQRGCPGAPGPLLRCPVSHTDASWSMAGRTAW